jgi:hypothetical protein
MIRHALLLPGRWSRKQRFRAHHEGRSIIFLERLDIGTSSAYISHCFDGHLSGERMKDEMGRGAEFIENRERSLRNEINENSMDNCMRS